VTNKRGREQHACDMRGRCCLGCDNGSKNSLDMNYLARAEDAGARIITLAEVTTIKRNKQGRFIVIYNDWLVRARDGRPRKARQVGDRVFLCAGAINTTELLLKNRKRLEDSN